jgi:hypothetical protein
MELVIDASVVLAWCFRDERTEATASLLERAQTDAAAVPNLWHLRLGLPVASKDVDLCDAAERLGVGVLRAA